MDDLTLIESILALDPRKGIEWIIFALAITAPLVALCHTCRLRNRPHERYKGFHVYAVRKDGTRVHVPREILEIYKHIKDPSISEKNEDPPNDAKYLISWGVILVLPRILSKIVRPFESDSGSKKESSG